MYNITIMFFFFFFFIVGLKLNLLDLNLEIDLQYLGVQLPIPPSVLSPEGSSASSQGNNLNNYKQ